MSTPTTLQGKLVPMAISTDGITYKNVVCKKVTNLNVDSAVNTEDTDCGPMVSLGSVNWTFDFEGVLNLTPDGATQMSANDILTLVNDQTQVYIKILYSPSIYRQGTGYLSNYTEKYDTNTLVSFTCKFTGQGVLDITA